MSESDEHGAGQPGAAGPQPPVSSDGPGATPEAPGAPPGSPDATPPTPYAPPYAAPPSSYPPPPSPYAPPYAAPPSSYAPPPSPDAPPYAAPPSSYAPPPSPDASPYAAPPSSYAPPPSPDAPPYAAPPDAYGAPYGAPPQPYPPQAMCAVHASTPAVGLCGRCGGYMCPWCQRVDIDGAILCASCAERLDVGGPVPWDLRPELGLWRAWWRTFKESLGAPNQFFARACRSPFNKAPLLFATMSVWFGQAWLILLYAGVGVAMAVSSKGSVGAGIGLAVGSVVGLTLMAPVSAVMQIYVAGGITHLFARMLGGRGSYQASARALGFAVGPYAIGIFPYLGGMAGMVASVVLQVFAIKHAHGLTGGKAAAAVLLPLGILMLLCCLGYAGLIAAVVAR